jgi:uncharacterized radical SAM superfamily protein
MTFHDGEPPVALVQLPFPNQEEPLPVLAKYYQLYAQEYRQFFPEYQLNEGDLWEAPLWIAHMDGAIGRNDTVFVDLSRLPFDSDACYRAVREAIDSDHILFFSPLISNLALTSEVSHRLLEDGYYTVVGGNVTEFASTQDFTVIYSGLARAGIYQEILSRRQQIAIPVVLGRKQQLLGYHPRYRLLHTFHKRVPLVRISASHGCLFACTFCGDAWSRQLHEVEYEQLMAEFAEIRHSFPETRLVYIGDKPFGQSPTSIKNLQAVLRPEYGYRVIVQTHVTMIDSWLIDAMHQLGVEVVEMGFETASSSTLRELKKLGGSDMYHNALEQLHQAGIKVVLNVLGGLPNETNTTHQETLSFLEASADLVWLHNLYNFVPYPKTPLYPTIRSRIIDWDFNNWREDKPVVFTPYNQSREQSWEQFLSLVSCATKLVEQRVATNAVATDTDVEVTL